jgi:hypothetical protein
MPDSSIARVVCSELCRTSLETEGKKIQLLLNKSVQNARASAFYYFLTSGLSAAGAVAAWFMLPAPFLIYFLAAAAVVLATAGFWHRAVARQKAGDEPANNSRL